MLLGLSVGNVVKGDLIKKMAKDPIIFAMANPTPEISYEEEEELIISRVLSFDPPSTITISSAFLVWESSESSSAPILPSSLNVVIQIDIFIS